MRYLFFILFYFFSFAKVFAQIDTFNLSEVIIQPNLRSSFQIGATSHQFDSTTLSQYQNKNVGDLLDNESLVFIKSYGLNSLATSSVRGANASHTKVLWNGLDISNSMLGQVDFSYLNTSFFDEISLLMGNTTGLYGGGTQGGVIQLNNNADFNKGGSINTTFTTGSFGNYSQTASVKTSKKKFYSGVHLHHLSAKNNFKFNEFNTNKHRENADVNALGVQLHHHIKLTQYTTISFYNWFQKNERGIPTVIGVPTKNERLSNDFFRNSLSVTHIGNKLDAKFSMAHFIENLNYINPKANITSESMIKKSITEAETKYKIDRKNEILMGYNATYDEAFGDNFLDYPTRLTNSIFAAFKSELVEKKWFISQSLRKEWVKNSSIPVTGSFGYEYLPSKIFIFTGSISKNYRIPTFNDLYYENLGNQNLNPEKGWGLENGLTLKKKKNWLKLTAFFNDYTNWINWQPQPDGLWRPQNNNVVTKGIEFSSHLEIKQFWWSFMISNVSSIHYEKQVTNQLNRLNTLYYKFNQLSNHNQMIYVPKTTANNTFGYQNKTITVAIHQQYTGKRYTSFDNTHSIPYFFITNISVQKTLKIKNQTVMFGAKINNIFNIQYQAILNQPMPKRFYEFNINLTLKNKPNDKKTT